MWYRKKPVLVEAVEIDQNGVFTHTPDWLYKAKYEGTVLKFGEKSWQIRTLEDGPNGEAKHIATPGDYIIKGVQGELYFCKPDIFKKTYEEA